MTGKRVQELNHHRQVVRDCSWHPYDPCLTSASFDGTLVNWDTRETDLEEGESDGAHKTGRGGLCQKWRHLGDPPADQRGEFWG